MLTLMPMQILICLFLLSLFCSLFSSFEEEESELDVLFYITRSLANTNRAARSRFEEKVKREDPNVGSLN